MDSGLLVSLSNQMVMSRKMDIIANNLANMSTTAFKRQSPLFEEFTVPVEGEDGTAVDVSFVRDYGVVRDLSSGNLETTGAPLDVAIEGKGYFVVRTAGGERFTRNGHFRVDEQGRLVTTEGHPVLAEGSEITFSREDQTVDIALDGTISSNSGVKGKLDVVTFDNEQAMKQTGDNLLETDQPPLPVEAPKVLQGMLEQSNVQPIVEMTQMIEVMRAYQNSTELTQAGEDMERRAIQKLGAVTA